MRLHEIIDIPTRPKPAANISKRSRDVKSATPSTTPTRPVRKPRSATKSNPWQSGKAGRFQNGSSAAYQQ